MTSSGANSEFLKGKMDDLRMPDKGTFLSMASQCGLEGGTSWSAFWRLAVGMLGHVINHMTPLYQIRLARLKTHNLVLGASHIVEWIDFSHTYRYRAYTY